MPTWTVRVDAPERWHIPAAIALVYVSLQHDDQYDNLWKGSPRQRSCLRHPGLETRTGPLSEKGHRRPCSHQARGRSFIFVQRNFYILYPEWFCLPDEGNGNGAVCSRWCKEQKQEQKPRQKSRQEQKPRQKSNVHTIQPLLAAGGIGTSLYGKRRAETFHAARAPMIERIRRS